MGHFQGFLLQGWEEWRHLLLLQPPQPSLLLCTSLLIYQSVVRLISQWGLVSFGAEPVTLTGGVRVEADGCFHSPCGGPSNLPSSS